MIARASFKVVPVTKRHPSIGGLVAEYIVAIDVTRVRFPADAAIPKARLALVGVRLWQRYKNV